MATELDGTSTTALSDTFTDVHLKCIDLGIAGLGARKLSTSDPIPSSSAQVDEHTEGEGEEQSDMYEQNELQELLVYQFAGLTRRAYLELSKALGNEFDTSAGVQDLRLNSWVSPVYARLQRRFIRFLASNVEDKVAFTYYDFFLLYLMSFHAPSPSFPFVHI